MLFRVSSEAMNSTTRIVIGSLLIGLVAGIGATLTLFPSLVTTGRATTITSQVTASASAATVTIVSVVYSTNTSTSGNSGISLSQIEAALNYSSTSKLNVTSYAFEESGPSREQLIVSLENVGSHPLIVSPNDILLNGTYYFQNTFLGPSGPGVGFGSFIYVAPRWSFVVEIVALHALSGDNSTLEIYDNFWSFKYGTAAFFE